jgi:hypothetical protein
MQAKNTPDPRIVAELSEWHLEGPQEPATPTAYAELQALASLKGAPEDLLRRAADDYERWLRCAR